MKARIKKVKESFKKWKDDYIKFLEWYFDP